MNHPVWEKVDHFFNQFVLFKIQDVEITPGHICVAIVAILLSLIASRIIRGILKKRVFSRLKVDTGLEYALLRFIHYAILACGVYIGLKVINIPLGALVGFFALLGVGIGFGLQNLASNFISGLILLIERPVKVGDRLEVDDVWGDVTRINLRTTIITTPDDIAIIVPNSKLLENNVTNYSYGNRRMRLHVPVGIAYGSDVAAAHAAMESAANEHSEVLKHPTPKVWFRGFGDSSLDMDLLCWISDAKHKFDVRSDLNRAIDDAFRERGITIPFPQRDLHILDQAPPAEPGQDA